MTHMNVFIPDPDVIDPGDAIDFPVGSIILWYGVEADLGAGWVVYSSAAGNLVMGASSGAATTVVAGANTHKHTNSDATTATPPAHSGSQGTASGSSAQGVYGISGETHATTSHTHGAGGTSVSAHSGHTHTLSDTDTVSNIPPSIKLYWIKRTA